MEKILPLDFHTAVFSGEIRKSLGEDSWTYVFCEDTGIIAVFDGCGGSGAQSHSDYNNHSEAYMASRICAGALYECINTYSPTRMLPSVFSERILERYLADALKANRPSKDTDGITIRGMRTLPTTMAAGLVQPGTEKELSVSTIWAGDSRVYVLDRTGLSQLTIDDSNQPDPMDGLYNDGTLTNVICADKRVRLNCRTYRLQLPFMLIAATDGCFGYVSSPMEFEGMVLHTMLESSSVAEWEENLRKLIASYAGDDHTMCLASFGFGSYTSITRTFQKRYEWLRKNHLELVWKAPWENRLLRNNLWKSYRKNYMKYIEDAV